MNKQEILESVSAELFASYQTEIKDAYASKEEFFESLSDLFDLFAEKTYNDF